VLLNATNNADDDAGVFGKNGLMKCLKLGKARESGMST